MRILRMRLRLANFCLAIALGSGLPVFAQSRTNVLDVGKDPRGAPELTICSQNLANYGQLTDIIGRVAGMDNDTFYEKEAALARRIATTGCDVIAVQEVIGKNEAQGEEALGNLAKQIQRFNNRMYEVHAGPSNDPMSRVGFLVAKDRAEVVNYLTYMKIELPKLTEKEKPRLFARGPYELQISVKPQGESAAKTVTLVTFHFKSKRGGSEDPAAVEWETYRMEMAEALRRVIENRHANAFSTGQSLLVVLGDRNSNFDVASAKILEGTLSLRQFRGDAPCRISKRGVPLCQGGNSQPQRLFSVLTTDPQTKLQPGTFLFKKEFSWLDEILMPSESLRFAWANYDQPGDYDSGVVYTPKEASDHALVYVRLNW